MQEERRVAVLCCSPSATRLPNKESRCFPKEHCRTLSPVFSCGPAFLFFLPHVLFFKPERHYVHSKFLFSFLPRFLPNYANGFQKATLVSFRSTHPLPDTRFHRTYQNQTSNRTGAKSQQKKQKGRTTKRNPPCSILLPNPQVHIALSSPSATWPPSPAPILAPAGSPCRPPSASCSSCFP